MNNRTKRMLKFHIAGAKVAASSAVLFVAFMGGGLVRAMAQQKRSGAPFSTAAKVGEPCCNITSIDATTGIVTARVNSTRESFQFRVGDAVLLGSLKMGQAVFANFKTQKVSVDGAQPCCEIVSIANAGVTGGAAGQNLGSAINPAQPCCSITSIDQQTGIVSARMNATTQVFQFKVTNQVTLRSLKLAQGVFANFKTQRVSVDGVQPCCNIVGAVRATPQAAAAPADISRAGARPKPAAQGVPPVAPKIAACCGAAVGSGANFVPQSGWMRYGEVAGTFPGGITLVPLTSVSRSAAGPSPVSRSIANGEGNFPIPVGPPGQIKGTTRVWTAEALRGFEGSLGVFLLDENGQPVFQVSEGPWGVNGQAIPGASSDRTVEWAESVPAGAMALARKIVIVHRYAVVDKWEDTLIQAATDLGYVVLGIGCLLIGNEFVIGTDGWSCQPPSGDSSSDSSQVVRGGANMMFSRQGALQLPHSGQMVWVNVQARQALWTAFPITAHQQDDLGNSDYMDTSIAVFYPSVEQLGPSPRAAVGGTPQRRSAGGTSVACCEIMSVDARGRHIAAKENSTGQAFEFSVPNSLPIESLHSGQPVWANFKSRKVSMDGETGCCDIIAQSFTQPPPLSRLADGGTGKNPVAPGNGVRPAVVELGGLWVPLGRVVSVGLNQLSIATVVPTQERSGGRARENSRSSTPPPTPAEGPPVTVRVEMANQSSSSKSGVAALENVTAGATTQGQTGQNTAGPGGVMVGRGGIMLRAPVPPLPGQMVWVNAATRQIRWVNFPFSMTQDDDLGDSHHLKTQISVSLPNAGTEGSLKGETRLWTFKEIGGFQGRVAVTFADDMGKPLYTIARPRATFPGELASWHVCGHSEPWCGDSDVTRDWGEQVPPDLLEQAAKVSITHGAEDTTGAEILQILCDVVGCSIGNCSHPPSPQNPPSTQNADPCGPSSGPS